PDRARRRRFDAQVAQRALVQVLVDDLEPPARGDPEDVDRAHLDQLLGQHRVGRDRRRHPYIDEHARHRQCPFNRSLTSVGMSSMRSATEMPAAFMRSILSAVVSALPSTIVPACPKRIPGISSMKRPAMNATTGRRDRAARTRSDGSASIRPPGWEQIAIASASGSASKSGISSAYVEPMIASPPMETAVDCPSPAAVRVLQISVVMPPERDITPIGPLVNARRTLTAGPPRPPILASSGDRMPRQFGPMMRAPRSVASSTICATSPRGMRSVTMTISLTPASIASNTASRVNGGGTVTMDPST